jgi:hypothetical protein
MDRAPEIDLPPDELATLERFAEEAGSLLTPFVAKLEAEPPPGGRCR